jgi:rhodanese-related sulfurtransferase
MKNILVLLLFIACFSAASAQNSPNINLIDKATFVISTKEGTPLIIDVRTPQEYAQGHIANALNIDYLKQDSFVQKFAGFNKTQPVYLYCGSGNRSGKAAKQLAALGFESIYDLKGGYAAWQR